MENIFPIALIMAAFLTSLVSGLLFAFAVVVMPGIRSLNDREFLRTFQVMDGIIQNNQPPFMLVWIGSVVTLLTSAVLGIGEQEGVARGLLIFATVAYVFGVQVPTATINIPLNNKLQTLDVGTADTHEHRKAREEFEPRWNRWNSIRTVISCLVSAMLLLLLLML